MTGAPVPAGRRRRGPVGAHHRGRRVRQHPRAGQAGQEHPPGGRGRRRPAIGCSRRARPWAGRDRHARQPGPRPGARCTGGRGWPSSPPAANWWRSTSRSVPGRSATPTATRCGRCAGRWASKPTPFGIVPDDYEATRKAIGKRAGVRRAAHFRGRLGRQVRLRQGRPGRTGRGAPAVGRGHEAGQAAGVRSAGQARWSSGCPGNPVSAMVSFELFVKPALLRLMGHRRTTRPLYTGHHRRGRRQPRRPGLRGARAGLARRRRLARQLHRRPGLGDA